MKTNIQPFVLVSLLAAIFTVHSFASGSQSAGHFSRTNLNFISPLQNPVLTNLPGAAAVMARAWALPAAAATNVPVVWTTNAVAAGTFWTMQSAAPLPGNFFPDLPVYVLDATNRIFLIDDRGVDYAALQARAATNGNEETMFALHAQLIDSNRLWLEVPTNALPGSNFFNVLIHETVAGNFYDVLTKGDLLLPTWTMAQTVTGAAGDTTPVSLPQNSRTNLFVWAREAIIPIYTQPWSQTIYNGDAVTFSVTAGGAGLSYQWTFNGTNIYGATGSSYTIGIAPGGAAGDYACVITSAGGTVVSDPATLTVLNWNLDLNRMQLTGDRQDYTFRRGFTYRISSAIRLHGRTTIEGGAVIKFETSGDFPTLQILGTLDCQTGPYDPAVLTSANDYFIGYPWGSGPPQPVETGVPFLDLTAAENVSLHDLRFRYADMAVSTPYQGRLDIWDSQFYQCNAGVVDEFGGVNSFHNVLFTEGVAVVAGWTNHLVLEAEQLTADTFNLWQCQALPFRVSLTNCVVRGTVNSSGNDFFQNCAFNPAATNFQTSGAGNYYLTVGSPLRHAGSTNFSARLRQEFAAKTTAVPLAFPAFQSQSGSLTLSPQKARENGGAPDLGFHYDALDYTIGQMDVAGSISVEPGTAVGFREEFITAFNAWTLSGFDLWENSSFRSHGLPGRRNVFADAQLVQEQPTFACLGDFTPDFQGGSEATGPVADFRFTDFHAGFGWYHFWSGMDGLDARTFTWLTQNSVLNWNLQDCTLWGGKVCCGLPVQSGYYGAGAVTWQNNFFNGVQLNLNPGVNAQTGLPDVDLAVTARNNLFRQGAEFICGAVPASAGDWRLADNYFDRVEFFDASGEPLRHDHNAYQQLPYLFYIEDTKRLPTGATNGAGDVVLDYALAFTNGPYGGNYLATVTPLWEAGSRTAADAGLAQYTTFLNQFKDASNQPVNIGLHYVTTTNFQLSNFSFQLLDSDGDGVPDYVEAEHGTDLNNPMTDDETPDALNAAYDDVDLSGDGLTGLAKQHFGLNPFSTEYPLNFPRANQTAVVNGTVTIPLQIGTNVDESEPLQLFVDNVEANAMVLKDGTNWLAVWDTTTIANGQHWLALKFCCEHQAGSSFLRDFYGSPVFVNVSNVLTFASRSKNFCDQLNIDATVNNGADTYSIDVYDLASSNLLTTLSGSVSNGMIQTSWDLKDGNGNTLSDGPVRCEYSLSSAASPNASPATATLIPRKYLHNGNNDTFAVAWGVDNFSTEMKNAFHAGFSGVVDLLNGFFDPFADPDLTYDILPAGGSGNVNNPGGTLSFNFSQAYSDSKDVLTQALRGSGNFLWLGHGKPTFIYPNLNDEGTKLTAKEIGLALNNDPGIQVNIGTNLYAYYVQRPYKLVFLFACRAYSREFADAFGIADFTPARTPLNGPPSPVVNPLTNETEYDRYLGAGRSTSTVQDYTDMKKIPQAYVGWPVNINAPDNKDEVNYETGNLVGWVARWQIGKTISECMNSLASAEAARLTSSSRRDLMGGLPPDQIEGILKWELSGCRDLKITDRNP